MKTYKITMNDGSVWAVPVMVIAMDKAQYYAKIDNVSVDDALEEVLQEFYEDHAEIADWAKNNMDWSDVKDSAICVERHYTDYETDWVVANYEIVEEDELYKQTNPE